MAANNFCFYWQNRLIETGQTGGQWYSDTSTFSIRWLNHSRETRLSKEQEEEEEITMKNAFLLGSRFSD